MGSNPARSATKFYSNDEFVILLRTIELRSGLKTVVDMVDDIVTSMDKMYGVYNADGGIMGEIAYVWGKIRGTAHCALCDITHRGVSKKKEWKDLEGRLATPMDLLHINEQDFDLARFTEGKTPCVVGDFAGELRLIMNSEDLEECGKSVEKFESSLSEKTN